MSFVKITMLIFSALTTAGILGYMAVGFFRGWKRGLAQLSQVIGATILAFLTVIILNSTVLSTITDYISSIVADALADVADINSATDFICSVIKFFANPIIFLVLYYIFYLLLIIPKRIVGKKLGIYGENYEKPTETKDRLLGMATYGVKAFIAVCITLMPFCGFVFTAGNLIDGTVETISSLETPISAEGDSETVFGYEVVDKNGNISASGLSGLTEEYIHPVTHNFYFSAAYSAPMKWMYCSMSGASNKNNNVDLMVSFVSNGVSFADDFENYGEVQKNAFSEIVEGVKKSDEFKGIVASLLSKLGKDVLSGEESIGISLEDFKEDGLDYIAVPVFEIFSETTPESLEADFTTINELFGLLIDYNVPSNLKNALESESLDSVLEHLGDEELIYKSFSALYANRNFQKLVSPVATFPFVVASKSISGVNPPIAVESISLTDEEIKSEAKIFSYALKNAKAVFDSIASLSETDDAIQAIENTDLAGIGRYFDNLRESKLIGSSIDSFFIDILNSEIFDGIREVADVIERYYREGMEGDGEAIAMEDVLSSVKELSKIVSNIKNTDGVQSKEDFESTLKNLNKALNSNGKSAASLIKDAIKESDMFAFSDSSESKTAEKMLDIFIDHMSESELSDKQIEKEANAVGVMLEIAKAASTNGGLTKTEFESIYKEDGMDSKQGMKNLVESLADSKFVAGAVKSVAFEEKNGKTVLTKEMATLSKSLTNADKQNYRSACEEYYKELVSNPDVDSETDVSAVKENIKAFGTILGVDINESTFEAWRK